MYHLKKNLYYSIFVFLLPFCTLQNIFAADLTLKLNDEELLGCNDPIGISSQDELNALVLCDTIFGNN